MSRSIVRTLTSYRSARHRADRRRGATARRSSTMAYNRSVLFMPRTLASTTDKTGQVRLPVARAEQLEPPARAVLDRREADRRRQQDRRLEPRVHGDRVRQPALERRQAPRL